MVARARRERFEKNIVLMEDRLQGCGNSWLTGRLYLPRGSGISRIRRNNARGGLRVCDGSRKNKSGGGEKAAENGAANVHPAPQRKRIVVAMSRLFDECCRENRRAESRICSKL